MVPDKGQKVGVSLGGGGWLWLHICGISGDDCLWVALIVHICTRSFQVVYLVTALVVKTLNIFTNDPTNCVELRTVHK